MKAQAVQPVVEIVQDKPGAISYWFSLSVAGVSALSWEAWGVIVGMIGVAITTGTNYYFKRRDDKRKERESQAAIDADRAKREAYRRDE